MQSSQGPLPHSDPLASEFYHNSNARSWSTSSDSSFIDNVKFHRQLEGYSPTPLVKLPSSILGLSPNKAPSIFLKDESNRLNLPSFKILGASWAVCNAVAGLMGFNVSAELDASEQDAGVILKLRDAAVKYSATLAAAAMSASPELELHGGLHLVAATEGNHGRAVAHMASMLGIAARVFVPASVTTASKALIKGEGSLVEIVVVDGDYDEAVRKALVWCREDPAVTLNPPRSSRLFIQDFLPPTSTTDAETALYGSAGSSFKTQAEKALRWIVDGYATLFYEIDEQLAPLPATPAPRKIDAIIIPCGAGSFAQGGVRYLRSSKRAGDNNAEGSGPIIILVEAASAAGLMHSLKSGQLETFPSTSPSHSGANNAPASTHTVMAGLDCATPSVLAWPDLRAGVDVVTAVSDEEVLRAMQDIQAITENDDHAAVRLDVGPCGAAPLAALRKLAALPAGGLEQFGVKFGPDSTIVLVSTESGKTYRAGTMQENGVTSELSMNHPIPSEELTDTIALAQALVRIASPNPDLSVTDSEAHPAIQSEAAIGAYISTWLAHWGFEVHRLTTRLGASRPTIIGVVRGTDPDGEGVKSLMFNGHIDTVSLAGYDGDPLSGELRGDELHGRGAYDMKGGVAAMLIAAIRAAGLELGEDHTSGTPSSSRSELRGTIVVACVADEEYASEGTQEVLAAGWGTTRSPSLALVHGAVIPEPTDYTLLTAHQGFAWFDIVIHGVAAHGSRADLGVDAIVLAGYFLVRLGEYAEELKNDVTRGTVHAGLIQGGQEPSTYPAKCTITVERRTVSGETPESVHGELVALLDSVASKNSTFKYEINPGMSRTPFAISNSHPFVELVQRCATKASGSEKPVECATGLFWADSALLMDAGIPTVLFGALGAGAHAATEWSSVKSLSQLTNALTYVAKEFCA